MVSLPSDFPINNTAHTLVVLLHIDLVTGNDFIYLDVPNSSHENVITMDDSPDGQQRGTVMKAALTEGQKTLTARQLLPVDTNLRPASARRDVTDVVFVIHDIRDRGFWTHKIARKVGAEAGRTYETATSSYGVAFFPKVFQMLH